MARHRRITLRLSRGSTGRGREFKNHIVGGVDGAEQDDIAAGARWLAGNEWIDEDRIAVYGGYSTFTQLFRCPGLYAGGIGYVGITDWQALCEESMPHFQAYAEEDAEFYRERSPVTYVGNLAAPLGIVHSVNDPRCPHLAGPHPPRGAPRHRFGDDEDGDFEYIELGEEGHGSIDIDSEIRSLRILEGFLERRVPVEVGAPADD